MKKKIVLWGKNDAQERIMIAVALNETENKIDLYTFAAEDVTEQFANDMMHKWRNDEEVQFPEKHEHSVSELSMSEDMLPSGIEVERDDVVQRAQTEWHFIVLSSKLLKAYQDELNELNERIEALDKFDTGIWEELKGFWDKVQAQARERNLFRDHVNILRKKTNKLFSEMKKLRAAMDAAFRKESKDQLETYNESLQDIENKIKEGLNLNTIFEELKKLQRSLKNATVTREHRSKIWNRLDAAFKEVKAKKYGTDPKKERSPMQRLKRRYDGLLNAISKMERSIKRDKKDLNFQDQRIDNAAGQLEAQIRQAKVKMVEERIQSKENKLQDMFKTKEDLEQRMEREKAKEAKREEQKRIAEAKKVAEAKIQEKIAEAAEQMKDKAEELEEAAREITQAKKKKRTSPKPKQASSGNKDESGEELDEILGEIAQAMTTASKVMEGKAAAKKETSSSSRGPTLEEE